LFLFSIKGKKKKQGANCVDYLLVTAPTKAKKSKGREKQAKGTL